MHRPHQPTRPLPDGDDDMTPPDEPITDFRALLHPMNRRRLLQGAAGLAGAAALGSSLPEPAYAQDKVLNLLVLARPCRPGGGEAVRGQIRRQGRRQGICRRRADAGADEPVAARLVRRGARRRRIYRHAEGRRLHRQAEPGRLFVRRLLARVPEVRTALARRRALFGADPLRLSRHRLSHRRAHGSRREVLQGAVGPEDQGQARLLRLVLADHGLPQPL